MKAVGGRVVLASASSARREMLRAAGVDVEVRPMGVDEAALKESLKAEGAPVEDAAAALADLKATRASLKDPEALVIGADQMLECGGVWFDKPPDRDHAAATLLALSGKTHRLVSAVVVAENGARIWHNVADVRLAMRTLSPRFVEDYLDQVGDAALQSVGAYQLEGLGAQLFTRVDGDYFTVLGMPLLPLLDFLRTRKVLPT